MSKSSDPDGDTTPSGGAPQGTESKLGEPEAGATAVDVGDGETRPVLDASAVVQADPAAGLPPNLVAALLEAIAAAKALEPDADHGGRHDLEPRPRKLDGIDFGTFILSSRYRTINAVMILLAVAVCVGASAFGSHTNPVFTVSLTTVGTVAATLGISAAKKRHGRRGGSQADTDDAKHGPENSNPT